MGIPLLIDEGAELHVASNLKQRCTCYNDLKLHGNEVKVG